MIYKDVGAAEGKRVGLDLKLLAAIREGQLAVIKGHCKNRDNCPEERLAEMPNAASKDPGFNWYMASGDKRTLFMKLPKFQGRRSPIEINLLFPMGACADMFQRSLDPLDSIS